MLCVERMRFGRLPTICEYEPRCPSIVVHLCNTEVREVLPSWPPQDVPDNAASRKPLRGTKPVQTTANARDYYYKSQEQPKCLGSTKVRCVKDIVEQNKGEPQEINSSDDSQSQSDIRNKTISPSWGPSRALTYKYNDKNYDQSDIRNAKVRPNSSILRRIPSATTQEVNNNDIRNTKIRPNSSILHSMPSSTTQEVNNNDIRNTKIRPNSSIFQRIPSSTTQEVNNNDIRNTKIRPNSSILNIIPSSTTQEINNSEIRNTKIRPNSSILHSVPCTTTQEVNDSGVSKPCIRNKKIRPSLVIPHKTSGSPAAESWRAVVLIPGHGDQVRVWTRDSKNLVVEAVNKDYSQSGSNSQKISQDCDDAENKSIFENYQHVITIPDEISLNSLVATLSPEGQLIIKEIRQQKPSSSNTVVIPIEKM